ncbi:MAG: glycosyltransferase [Candidatus Omnitrophica bacterium]|nr:glycosyltransferase [Candidatus Omnitrophota bacterium]
MGAPGPLILVAVHIVVRPPGHVHGPGDNLREFLKRSGVSHVMVYHALHGGHPSRVVECDDQGRESERLLGSSRKWPLPLQILCEGWRTGRVIRSIKRPISVFIGVDPVNAGAGAFWKRFGKIDRLIFYTADFALNRFAHPLLNALYHQADAIAVRSSDEVWNVSSRILNHRLAAGVPAEKLKLVPNSPAMAGIPGVPERLRHRQMLVSMATNADALENRLVIEAMGELLKKYPQARLQILGAEDPQGELLEFAQACGAAAAVEITGLLPQEQVLQRLSRAAVGIALYTDAKPWTRYGDAKKVREYMACGLPVVMTDVPSTADEVSRAGAGEIIPMNKEALCQALDRLLGDENYYRQRRDAALNLARRSDADLILQNLLFRLKIS